MGPNTHCGHLREHSQLDPVGGHVAKSLPRQAEQRVPPRFGTEFAFFTQPVLAGDSEAADYIDLRKDLG